MSITITAPGHDNSPHTYTLTRTISDTHRIEPLGPLYSRGGERIEVQVLASDALGNTLTYQLSGQPGTLTIDTVTGLISGYISYRNVTAGETTKPFHVTVSVTGGGAADYRTFDWTLEDVPRPPMAKDMYVLVPYTGSRTFVLPASDDDGDNLEVHVVIAPSAGELAFDSSNPLRVIYTLEQQSARHDEYVYRVADSDGLRSREAKGTHYRTFRKAAV